MGNANEAIRVRAKEKGVYLWEVADRIGMNDANFSRKLRHELPEKDRERIFGIIADIAGERSKNNA